jgi:hypothetical protein
MYFGRFLLENSKVEVKELISAISYQLSHGSSVIEALIDLNLLDDKKIFDLVEESYLTSRPILGILQESGEIPQKNIEEIIQYINTKNKPLSEVIVEKGFLNADEMNQYIENYLAQSNEGTLNMETSNDGDSNDKLGKDNEAESDQAGPAINLAALESLKEINGIDDETVKELERQSSNASGEESEPVLESISGESSHSSPGEGMDIFKEQLFSLFSKNFYEETQLKVSNMSVENYNDELKDVFDNVKKLLGASKLANYSILEKLFNTWSKVLTHLLENHRILSEELLKLLREMIEIAWDLRNQLESGTVEAKILEDDKLKQLFLDNIKLSLKELKIS